jgi:hypothetical protein
LSTTFAVQRPHRLSDAPAAAVGKANVLERPPPAIGGTPHKVWKQGRNTGR